MDVLQLFTQGDGLSRLVSLLLLGMSVGSWVIIAWKVWLLRRSETDITRSTQLFWQTDSLQEAHRIVQEIDRESLVLPLLSATDSIAIDSLAAKADRGQQLTRLLREALHQSTFKLQYGQVILATIGATAPFVGLLGTVWGIYNALVSIAGAGQISIDKVAGPVGEALVMTAAGLGVALPAVVAYNLLGRRIARLERVLEGFARDLRDLLAQPLPMAPAAQSPEAA